MKKSLQIIFCAALMLVGFTAMAGEHIYVRLYVYPSGKNEVYVLNKGAVEEYELENANTQKSQALKSFGDLLEGYLKQGYKLVGTSSTSLGQQNTYLTEYILEKQ